MLAVLPWQVGYQRSLRSEEMLDEKRMGQNEMWAFTAHRAACAYRIQTRLRAMVSL